MPRFNTTGGASARAFSSKGPRRVTPTTFSATDQNNSTLSGGNLIRTGTGNNYAIATYRPTEGKYYFEITDTTDAGRRAEIGIANSNFGITGGGSDGRDEFNGGNTIYAYAAGGIWIASVNTITTFPLFTSGDIICIALDMLNRRVWFRKNNGNWNDSPTANPTANAEGIALSSIGIGAGQIARIGAGSGVGTTQTANFGATTMTYAVPANFSVGFGSQI